MENRTKSRSEIEAAKERLRIPELWRILGLEGEPGKSCRLPYREDRKPSGSVSDDGRRFHDFSNGEDLDAIAFLGRVRGLTNGEAVRQFLELANGYQSTAAYAPIVRAQPKSEAERPILSCFRKASHAELQQIADSRRIDVRAVELAQDLGTLRVGEVCGYQSWILFDESGLCAEGRRLNREPYPPVNGKVQLGERKAHTLRGSRKDWPVGILPAEEYRQFVEVFALVEGGPDYLAALHFGLAQKRTGILPAAILGRGVCHHGLHPGSLQYVQGRRVRIYPHNDADGASYQNALIWANQLQKLDCEVDFFVFEGLRKADGTPIKDLNDCVEVAPEQAGRLEELFP